MRISDWSSDVCSSDLMYQAALETASAEAIVWMLGKYDSQNPAALKRLLGGGTQLRPFPKPVMDAAYDAANELYAEISAKNRSEEHKSELQSLMRISYAVFCLKKKTTTN